MRIIISPAKKMNMDTDSLPYHQFPQFLPEKVRILTCTFGEWKSGKVVEKGTLCKMARGQMVRWLAENQITDCENIKAFSDYGYVYDVECSTSNHYVFIAHPINY